MMHGNGTATVGVLGGRRALRVLLHGSIALLLLAVSGCSYKAKNALPAHMKTIAVPIFKNKTFVADYTRKVEVEVTDAVRDTFIQTGELKLAGRENADLILEGEVNRFEREVLRADRYGDPAEVRLSIRARVSVYDVKEAKYVVKDLLVTNTDRKTESGVFNLRRGEGEDVGRKRAIEDLGRNITRQITELWPTK